MTSWNTIFYSVIHTKLSNIRKRYHIFKRYILYRDGSIGEKEKKREKNKINNGSQLVNPIVRSTNIELKFSNSWGGGGPGGGGQKIACVMKLKIV